MTDSLSPGFCAASLMKGLSSQSERNSSSLWTRLKCLRPCPLQSVTADIISWFSTPNKNGFKLYVNQWSEIWALNQESLNHSVLNHRTFRFVNDQIKPQNWTRWLSDSFRRRRGIDPVWALSVPPPCKLVYIIWMNCLFPACLIVSFLSDVITPIKLELR